METMVQFDHHDHRLAFVDEDKNEEPKLHTTCSICDLPMLSSPSYTCQSQDCKFSVHKPCAQLPHNLHHPHYSHVFMTISTYQNATAHANISLQKRPRAGGPHNCQVCHKPCRGFTYTCCEIDLHPLCARPTAEIRFKHESHDAHPLVATCREMLTMCNACGEEHYGFFFYCQECNFWIHRDCMLMPSVVKIASHPDHPLILTYAFFPFRNYDKRNCNICGKELRCRGAYSCSQCDAYAAHISCATSNTEEILASGNKFFMKLPDEGTTFPSLIIRNLENKTRVIGGGKESLTIGEYHKHPLVFHDNNINTKHENLITIRELETLLCDACTQPIENINPSPSSSPFWGCARPDCHFSLHNFCKEKIPYKVQTRCFGESPFVLHPTADDSNLFFHSIFTCFLCLRPCGGFSYHIISEPPSSFCCPCDLECISTPKTIKHASHGKHFLFQMSDPQSNHVQIMRCCSDRYRLFVYNCALCDFKIHIGCAFLPQKVRHKFDKHLLGLVFTNDRRCWVEKECCFCEFCEQDIDQRYWFYHCIECDQSFHIKCIPSVGLLSKIKFGGTLHVPCHPRHPVALTRMLTESDQRCGYCKQIIHGRVDDMAFYCSECEFWIHFVCARDCCYGSHQAGRPQLWYEYKNQRESILPFALT